VLILAGRIGRYTWARVEGMEFLQEADRVTVIEGAKAFAKKLGVEVAIDSIDRPGEIAELTGKIDHAEFARLRNDALSVSPEKPMTLGMALLLGPANNLWHGELPLKR
jgi:predicted RecB family endonuclease